MRQILHLISFGTALLSRVVVCRSLSASPNTPMEIHFYVRPCIQQIFYAIIRSKIFPCNRNNLSGKWGFSCYMFLCSQIHRAHFVFRKRTIILFLQKKHLIFCYIRFNLKVIIDVYIITICLFKKYTFNFCLKIVFYLKHNVTT